RLAGRGAAGDDVLVAYGPTQGDAGGLGPTAQGVEFGAVVVVAGDRHHVGAGPTQRGQRPRHDELRVRRRRGGVEQVAGDDDQIRPLGVRDLHDLLEYRDML